MAELREVVYLENEARVDESKGIIYGVKLLGENSKNGRRYTPEAMRQAVQLYEGAKLYVDHPGRGDFGADRKFGDWAGVFENVRYREGQGIFANERLRKSNEHFGGIIEAARNFPTSVGHSHVADASFRQEGNTEIVESIEEVFSVDLVTDPATTAGMFESRNKRMSDNETIREKVTLKRLIESTPTDTNLLSLLVEMNGNEDHEVEVEKEGSKEGKVKEGLLSAISAKLQGASDAVLQAVVNVLEQGGPVDAAETTESKLLRKIALMEAKTMLLEANREATDVRVRALSSAPEADRKSLLESWPKQGVNRDINRPAYSPPATSESGNGSSGSSYESRFNDKVKIAESRLNGVA